jgi:hypothetical protein
MQLNCEIKDMINEVYLQVIVYTLKSRASRFLDGKCLLGVKVGALSDSDVRIGFESSGLRPMDQPAPCCSVLSLRVI